MNNGFRGSVNQSQATDVVWTNEESRDKIKWHLVVLPRLHVTHLPENTTCAYRVLIVIELKCGAGELLLFILHHLKE